MEEDKHSKRKRTLQESIRNALQTGVISDETLAYIRALSFARARDPEDSNILEAVRQTMSSLRALYGNRSLEEMQDSEEEDDCASSMGEGQVSLIDEDRYYHKFSIKIPEQVTHHLESRKLILMPLELGSSSLCATGNKRKFAFSPQESDHIAELHDLESHWIGLYFKNYHEVGEAHITGQERTTKINPQEPIPVSQTNFTFSETNLRNSSLDLFYPALSYQMHHNAQMNDTGMVYLSLHFQKCWVKGMNLQFWRYAQKFPGTVTMQFDDCEDFEPNDFPYLTKQLGGELFYLDLEKFADYSKQLDSSIIEEYLIKILESSDTYSIEHLR